MHCGMWLYASDKSWALPLYRHRCGIPGRNLSALLHKADVSADGESGLHEGLCCITCKYWSHLCQGTTLHSKTRHGRSIWHVYGEKRPLLLFSFDNMYQRGVTRLHSALSLKRANRSDHEGHKALLRGLLLGNLKKLCRLYRLTTATISRLPHLSLFLPFCASALNLTCRSSREILKGRSLHYSVGVSHHEHLVEYCIMVDETLNHARRFHILQVLFTEDNGHLWAGRRRVKDKELNGKDSDQSAAWSGLKSNFIQCCWSSSTWYPWQANQTDLIPPVLCLHAV